METIDSVRLRIALENKRFVKYEARLVSIVCEFYLILFAALRTLVLDCHWCSIPFKDSGVRLSLLQMEPLQYLCLHGIKVCNHHLFFFTFKAI